MSMSTQQRKGRVRAPRVHLTYEVETEGAIRMISLPFVLGVMADLTGDRQKDKPLPTLAKREFTDINPDNFDKVLESSSAHLEFTVGDRLSDKPDSDSQFPVKLDFEKLSDFSPEHIAQSFDPTKELLQTRMQMHNLLTRLEAQAEADSLLKRVITSTSGDGASGGNGSS